MTNDSLVFSEVSEMYDPFDLVNETVHLKGAQPSQIQQFLDALPASIKGKRVK